LQVDDKVSFSQSQLKSLGQVGEMVKRNGGVWLLTLNAVVEHLNKHYTESEEYVDEVLKRGYL
jgi:hypothetical protein